jgi:WD40 repeat protein
VVADLPTSARGGSWHGDTIVFGTRFDGLYRVSATGGGKPEPLTQLDKRTEATHRWPVVLPDGRHVLYLTSPTGGESDVNAVWVAPLDRPAQRKRLVATVANCAVAGDYLVFVRERALVAQKLDLDSLSLTGEPLPVAAGVGVDPLFSRAMFDATANTLVLQTGSSETTMRLMVTDRKGTASGEVPAPGHFGVMSLSPDGRSVAFSVLGSGANIWVVERSRGTASRLTFGVRDIGPVWSPDGKSIAYSRPPREIVIVPADGSGAERVVTRVEDGIDIVSWSPDGRFLVITHTGAPATNGLSLVSLADGSVRRLVRTTGRTGAAISRDGRWLAYSSEESGVSEVYVTRFPEGGGKWQVSSGGGRAARWSRDGKELYFIGGNDMLMAVAVTVAGDAPQFAPAEALFNVPGATPGVPYDVAPDGSFLVTRPVFAESKEPLKLITNWQEKLRPR